MLCICCKCTRREERWFYEESFPWYEGECQTSASDWQSKLSRGKTVGNTQENGIRVDKEAYVAYLNGKPLDLTLKEYEILCYLTENKGRVFTRDQLLDAIWGYDFYGNSRTVDSHVARLRIKLGDFGETHLKTVYGTGYKFQE